MGSFSGGLAVDVEGKRYQVSLGRWEVLVQVLVVLNMIAFAFETLPTLAPEWRTALWYFEVFSVAVFTIEYGFRLWLARPRWKYVTSFYGIVDLLAILPFYLMLAFDLRSLRAFRLLRLFRMFKLVRFTQAAHRFRRAFAIAREDLVLFGVVALIVLYLAAVGIYHFEHDAQPEKFTSVFDSLWWAVVTLTTVGYGDIYPITAGGRLFTFLVLVLGLGVIAVPSGLLAAALTRVRAEDVARHRAASAHSAAPEHSD